MPDYSNRFDFNIDATRNVSDKPADKSADKPAERPVDKASEEKPEAPRPAVSEQPVQPASVPDVPVTEPIIPEAAVTPDETTIDDKIEELQNMKPEVQDDDAEPKPSGLVQAVPEEQKKERQWTAEKLKADGSDFGSTVRVQLPKSMVNEICRIVPDADNNLEAVATYLYVALGKQLEVPQRIKELSECVVSDGGVSDMGRQLDKVEKMLVAARNGDADSGLILRELEILLIWLVAERMDYHVNASSNPNTMDFTFPESGKLSERARRQAEAIVKREKNAAGRAAYQKKFNSSIGPLDKDEGKN